MNIPIAKPYLDKDEEKSAIEVLRSGWLSQGPRVQEFEERVAAYVGAQYCVAATSCTTALHLALSVLGIREGDEVIMPSYTFIATANAVSYCKAKPIFVDIDLKTYNIDPELIEQKITKRTKVIIPVHTAGLPCDMDKILRIAKKYNLFVLEDAACALGAEYEGRRIGSLGSHLTCFSFHPRKVITTGEGGMITANNKHLAKRLISLRNHGVNVSAFERHQAHRVIFEKYPHIGYNYRMSDIQAAIGVAQMGKLDKILSKRIKLAQNYNRAFQNHHFIITPYIPQYAVPNYQSYIIRLNKNSPVTRNRAMYELLKKGIATRRGIMAIHLEPCYKNKFKDACLPNTEKAVKTTIILPSYFSMTKDKQNFVIHSLLKILKK